MIIPDKEAEKAFLALCKIYGKISIFVGYLNRRDLLPKEVYTPTEEMDEYGFSRTFPWRNRFAEIEAEFLKAKEALDKVDPKKI